MLARGLANELRGAEERVEVTVVARAAERELWEQGESFRVVFDAGFFGLVQLIWRSDIVLLPDPALLPLVLAWLLRKKTVVHHQGYRAFRPDGTLLHFAEQCACEDAFGVCNLRKYLRCQRARLGWWRGSLRVGKEYALTWFCERVAANVPASNHLSERLGLPRSMTIYNAAPDATASDERTNRNHDHPYQAAECARSRVADASSPLIAFVGRIMLEEGISILLQAAASLASEGRTFRLRIIGEGPETGNLAALAYALDIRDRVEFTGALSGGELEDALAGVLAIVVPSLTRENDGLIAAEQMKRGRVIIASDTGSPAEIVGNAGLRFPQGDVPALEDCLRRVLTEPELRAKLGRAASARALTYFTAQRMLEDYARLVRQILARPIRARRRAEAERQAQMISRVMAEAHQKRPS